MRILLALSASLWPIFTFAHGVEEEQEGIAFTSGFWDRIFWSDILPFVYIASAVIAFLVLIIVLRPPKSNPAKVFFFSLISLAVILTTLFIASGTVYQNLTSATGGPVHWHADLQVFNCGEGLKLVSPAGALNRVGTPDVHEHGDGRIHIEGKIKRLEEASLHGFFEAVGGTLTEDELAMPTNDGLVYVQNGKVCPDGSPGTLQVFLWKTTNGILEQLKLADFPEYVISPESVIPPGDCVIIEFGPEKEKTENICLFYEIALDKGDIKLAQ